jgi:hypothetical protein
MKANAPKLGKAFSIILSVVALGCMLLRAQEGEQPKDEKPKPEPEKQVRVSKERLLGEWKAIDSNSVTTFEVTFTNTVWESNLVEVADLRIYRVHSQREVWGGLRQEAPDKPFTLSNEAEFIPLAGDRLRLRLATGLVVPWEPTEAILERVKTNSVK